MNHRVQRFTRDGEYLGGFGSHGSGDGEFDMPWGLTVDSEGSIYVADWRNRRVQKFDGEGNFLLKFEASISGVGALEGPTSVAVDSEGDVYVTDWGAHLLQVYASDGRFITSLVGDAQQPSPWTQTYIDANPDIIKARRRVDLEPEWRFRRPVAVKVDRDDRIFVLEAARHRMQILRQGQGLRGTPPEPVRNCLKSPPPMRVDDETVVSTRRKGSRNESSR